MPTLVDILKYQLVLDDSQFKAKAAQADAQVNQLAGSIGGKLTAAVGLLAGAFTALKIGDFLKDATLTAARTEVLGTALSVVGKNAGVSQGELALLEEQVKALGITTQEARTSIIRFIQSGLPLSKIAELARLAQDSAVTAGINSSEAFERLTRGIQTGQIELLRTAGVFVSIESELNKFAKSTGKAREGLSDIERQTVILNAVLAQGSKLAGNYEAAMGDVGKQLTSLPRFFEELQNAIGTFFLPVMEQGVGVASKFLKVITDLLTNEELLRARSVITRDNSVAEQEEERNRILDERRKLSNLLLLNEAKYAALIAQNNIAATALAAGVAIGMGKQRRDIEELDRAYDALGAKIEKAFAPPEIKFPSGPMTDAIRRIPTDAFIDLPVKAVIDDGSEEFFQALLNDEFEKQQTIVFDFKLKDSGVANAFQDELDAIAAKFKKLQESINDGEFFSGPMSLLGEEADRKASIDEGAREVREKFEKAFRGVGDIASAVFRGIGDEAGQAADAILGIMGNFSVGNFAGGIAGIISSIAGFLGGGSQREDMTARLIDSQAALIQAITDWRDSILNLSDVDRAQREAAAQDALRLLTNENDARRRGGGGNFNPDTVRAILAAGGIDSSQIANRDLLEFVKQILADLGTITASGSQILAATTAQTRQDLINQARSAQDANFLVDSFAQLFDISNEEQLKLLQSFMDRMKDQLSGAELVNLQIAIEDLKDEIAGGGQPSQTERSIARVSERQGDSLISGIATMDLHLREGFQAVVDALTGFAANALDHLGNATVGTQINIASVSLEGADATAVETILVKNMNNANRAAGNARLS